MLNSDAFYLLSNKKKTSYDFSFFFQILFIIYSY